MKCDEIVENFDLTADRLSTFDHFRLTSVMNGINFKQLNVVLCARYDYEYYDKMSFAARDR